MSKLTVTGNGYYTVEQLYQWDTNQVLYIYGVSVSDPEIHIANGDMARSIVVTPTVDEKGVIMVGIPNSLLQKASPLKVYICGYDGSTFKTYYKIDIPVKGRVKPEDYSLTNDK